LLADRLQSKEGNMRPSRIVLLALLAAVISVPAFPAARLTYAINGTSVPVSWKSFPISYAIDKRVADAAPNGVGQIENAVAEWSEVAEAQIAFDPRGVANGLKAGKDGQNSITIADDLFVNQKYIAMTTNWYDDNGRIIEADIQIDPLAMKSGYNLQLLLEHEAGHLLGLDHSAVLSSVMYPYVGSGNSSALDSDDRVIIATVYPRSAPPVGATLQGRVSGDEGGIYAAQVVALNDAGEPVSTALSERDGTYTLQGLPSGNYRIYAEPLDGPVNVTNLSGAWRLAKVKSFPTQFADGGVPLRVESGKIYGNINVNGAGAVQLNPKWIGIAGPYAQSVNLGAMPITVKAGQLVTIAVGGDGFLSGVTTFDLASPSVERISDYSWSSNYVSATFRVNLDAPAGSVVVLAKSGSEAAALTGALRVEPRGRARSVIARK
jgi:Matrixin